MTSQELIKITGQHLLFCGVDTYSWTLDQFKQCAQFARAHGVDNLLVKVADGGNIWYGGLGEWEKIRKAILAEGVGAIPYIYSYGDKFGALDVEIDLLNWLLQNDGIACMNAEIEWNGQVQWAQRVASRLHTEDRVFMISTWADPSLQDWQGVIQALTPCTTAFMPQQYNNYLATFWGEFGANGATWLQPTVNLTQDFGANDPVQIATAAHGQGHTAISVWYYDTAVANPALLDAVYAAFPKQQQQGGDMVPQGWTDDGTTLTAPNGHKVVLGFREYVLANRWDANNVPLEEEQHADPVEESFDQPGANSGQRQMFAYAELAYTPQRGVYLVAIGNELLGARRDRDQLRQDSAHADLVAIASIADKYK